MWDLPCVLPRHSRVPVDSVFVDWGGSVYTRTLPAMEFHNVTLKQLAYELFDRTFKKWYDSGEVSEATFSFEIENKQTLKIKRSFAFAGINLRDAIREICCSYGVRYDFRRHAWEDSLIKGTTYCPKSTKCIGGR